MPARAVPPKKDPADWWRSITAAVRALVARAQATARSVVGVAVTAQWSGTVAVGADGEPLMNAIVWMDSRGARHIGRVTGGAIRLAGYDVRKLRLFVSRAGGIPGHSGKDPAAHIRWIRNERPGVYAATRVFLEPADYLNLGLTGRVCSSFDCIALHWVTDNRTASPIRSRRWPRSPPRPAPVSTPMPASAGSE